MRRKGFRLARQRRPDDREESWDPRPDTGATMGRATLGKPAGRSAALRRS